MHLTVSFSENVDVTGTPTLALALQDGSRIFFFFNDTAPPEISPLPLPAALPFSYATATLAGQLTNGHTYTITARSTDPAGNTGTTTRTFVYDTTAPTVSNVSPTKTDVSYTH